MTSSVSGEAHASRNIASSTRWIKDIWRQTLLHDAPCRNKHSLIILQHVFQVWASTADVGRQSHVMGSASAVHPEQNALSNEKRGPNAGEYLLDSRLQDPPVFPTLLARGETFYRGVREECYVHSRINEGTKCQVSVSILGSLWPGDEPPAKSFFPWAPFETHLLSLSQESRHSMEDCVPLHQPWAVTRL